MVRRGIGEAAPALALFPANRAQGRGCRRAKLMLLEPPIVTQPLQRLALVTHRLSLRFQRRHHVHIGAHVREHGHVPPLPANPLGLGSQISHVRHDMGGPPRPTPSAIGQTGKQQSTFGNIGWRCPTDQRHQQHAPFIARKPEPKRVLLVADEPLTLSALERACAQRRPMGGVEAGTFF